MRVTTVLMNTGLLLSTCWAGLTDVHFCDTRTGWAVGSSGAIVATGDGGVTWTPQVSGVSSPLYAIDCISESKAVAAGENGVILSTADRGNHWRKATGEGTGAYYGMAMVDQNTGFAVGGSGGAGTIVGTVDGGVTWLSVATPECAVRDLAMQSETHGCAVDQEGNALVTADGWHTYEGYATGSTRELVSVSFGSRTTGFAVNQVGDIYKTVDGGRSWSHVLAGSHQLKFSISAVSENICFAAGTESMDGGGGIFRTTDGGRSWEMLQGGLSGPWYYGIHFVNDNVGFAVGDNDIVLSTANGGQGWREQTVSTVHIKHASRPLPARASPRHCLHRVMNLSGRAATPAGHGESAVIFRVHTKTELRKPRFQRILLH